MAGVSGTGSNTTTPRVGEQRVETDAKPEVRTSTDEGKVADADQFDRSGGSSVDVARPGAADVVVRDATLEAEARDRLRLELADGRPRGTGVRASSSLAAPAPVTSAKAAPPPTAKQLIEAAPNTFDLATRQLEAGDGAAAANILAEGAKTLRAGIPGAGSPEKDVLETLANNMDRRAQAYRQTHPDDVMAAAGSLNLYARNATIIGEGIAAKHPEYGQLLQQVGRDSKVQAELLYGSAANTKSMIGRGVAKTYRDIVNASFDHDIANTGSINNFFTGSRDELERDKAKMNTVFDYMDTKMQNEGLSFHEAWHSMFEDNHIPKQGTLPGFATPHDAAAFLRDHESTKGLLAPMAELSEGILHDDAKKVDRARGEMVESLRENGQWNIAKQVLEDYKANPRTPDGEAEAGKLTDNERSEYWKAKATEFATEDLPVLLLTGVVTGGAGLGARALATTAGWGVRAARTAQVATELATFVPTERVLSDAINGKRADWSASGLARDYALTIGGYGLFRALGAGWKAIRSPSQIKPNLGADAARVAEGRATNLPANEAKENIRALTRENESAQTLAQNGYHVVQNPPIPGGGAAGVKMPDYRIGGHLFDNYAPNGSSARNIWTNVQGKVQAEQARRIVLNLDDSKVTMEALQKQFAEWPIEGLEQLLIVRGGKVTNFPLPKPPSSGPWITPGAYPHQEADR
ncbi:MAG: hypothetical protein KC933_26095 [Myxococcales bacterium]|nr:hypothetical protein [Myxococcales bacterium]